MEIYSTEEQQVDAIKQFWKDYGTSVVIGAVVGLGSLYGWNTYSDHKIAQQELASEAYQQIGTLGADVAAVETAAANFKKDYSQAGYQAMLDLVVAKTAVDAGDLVKAASVLEQVAKAKPGANLDMVANIRLARIQAEMGELDKALATLDLVTVDAFAAQRDELKGDFLLRKGEANSAREAYQAAVDKGGISTSPGLQMKLDNLNQA